MLILVSPISKRLDAPAMLDCEQRVRPYLTSTFATDPALAVGPASVLQGITQTCTIKDHNALA